MIDSLIELAHAKGLVRSTALEADGCDAYQLRALPRPITVWVRPDGRFSRATADDELLTLGQATRALLAVVEAEAAHPELAHAASTRRLPTRIQAESQTVAQAAAQ